jgi:hypothetical protein
MKKHELSKFSIPDYKLSIGFSRKTYPNGGLCIFIKDNIVYQATD